MADYEHCQVLTTTESPELAETMATGAVEARLAASVQVDLEWLTTETRES